MKIPHDYFERVYAGWLGKIIGIRLGAAIEGWSYEAIKNTFGNLTNYPVSYRNFAADDDSNGPLFFIRALEDCRDIDEFSAADVGEALLNYAPYEHGFFWWGGYGISTEHTAYLNLRNGIPAPRSGSIAQNGSAVAEQIGGQIFIDSWGLVAPGSPELAARLAQKAASVSHDGNGVWGGIFIACCVSLAFVEKDINAILEKALKYIPADCEYARVTRSVMDFHRKNPQDWRSCFKFLDENFGYHKYPGNCHIIPNAGVIILSLLYGNGDFDDTINICNMCGWDTDCNVGNAACILGVLVGIDGIDYHKWAKPINDFLASSSVVPSLNATDIPFGASYFARLAYRLAKENPPKQWEEIIFNNIHSCHFEYPGSTHAIRGRCPGQYNICNTEEHAHSGSRSLKISVFSSDEGSESFFYKQCYYGPEDFSDSRYDPFFAPLAYPGQTIHVSLLLPDENKGIRPYARLYARDIKTGELVRGEQVFAADGWQELSLELPGNTDGIIGEIGVILGGASSINAYIDDLYADGSPDYRICFTQKDVEKWNGLHSEIRQFSRLKGLADIEGDCLSLACCDFGEMYTGYYSWTDYSLEAELIPKTGEDFYINLRVQGAMRCYALGFSKGMLCLKKNLNGYTTLKELPFAMPNTESLRLALLAEGKKLTAYVDSREIFSYTDDDCPILSGSAGISVQNGSRCLYKNLRIRTGY